tara:strand:+ start:1128 stop:1877 length:750 start_codon:yes stop_codon:yes gene_type:complete
MKYFLKYLIKSIKSFTGYLIFSILVKSKGNFPTLNGKKILVLGTGPSLEKLSQKTIDEYDVIFLITHAIKLLNKFNFKKKEVVFYCADGLGLYEVNNEVKNKNIYNLIFIIHYFRFSFLMTLNYKKVKYIFSKVKLTNSYNKRDRTNSILSEKFFTKKNDIYQNFHNNVNVFPYTGSLSLFHFLILNHAKIVHALGCDYNNGRTQIVTTTKLKSTFNKQRSKILLWFKLLQKLALSKNCELKNLSLDIK